MWNKLTLYLWSLSFLIWIYLKGGLTTRAPEAQKPLDTSFVPNGFAGT